MPGTKLNLNAATNGTTINRLTLGELPDVMRRQLTTARQYRRNLEQAVADIKSTVNLEDAHWIDECCTAEIHAAVCRWLLRERFHSMESRDILKCSEQILKSKTVRNRAFERLNLTAAESKLIEALYADVTPSQIAQDAVSCDPDPNTTEITPEITNAGDAKSDAENQEHDR